MYVCEKDIQKTKARIEKYYQNCRDILWQCQRLKRLLIKQESISNDINNPKLNLSKDVGGIRYDNIIVMGGALPASSMDKEIEKVYHKLEKEYLLTETEIIQTNMQIRELESDNEVMEYCIRLLSAENKKILQKKFNDKKSLIQISFEMNMSKSTISRILYGVYVDISKLLSNIENMGQKWEDSGTKVGNI